MPKKTLHFALRGRRSMVLITAMWIIIALTAVVLVLCREMVVESMTARQNLAQAKAEAAETGMEQFVMSVLAEEQVTPGYIQQTTWEKRRIGDCYCWVITNNPDGNDSQVTYGPTDEGGKLDLNTATFDQLMMLPGMTEDAAYAILDWVDPDDINGGNDKTTSGGNLEGAESPDYEQAFGYRAKNAPFETVEELKLISGVDDSLLYGADTNHNGWLERAESDNADPGMNFQQSGSFLGMLPFVTAYGMRATVPATQASSTSTTSTNGSVSGGIVDPNSTQTTIGDINATNTQQLQTVLQQYLPNKATAIINAMRQGANTGGRGAPTGGTTATAATSNKYKSILDWAIQMKNNAQVQLTGEDLTAVYPFLTCTYTFSTTTQPAAGGTTGGVTGGITGTNTTQVSTQPTAPVAKINVMSASPVVLYTLPNFTQDDVNNLLTARQQIFDTSDYSQMDNIGWLLDSGVDLTKLQGAGAWITGKSYVYSADIVTVSKDGRAFKRVRIVVDVTSGTPQMIYRRDLTNDGWPFEPEVRDRLRKGQEPDVGR